MKPDFEIKRGRPPPYPRLLDDPVLFPELLLDTTEMALAMASTADSLSANVFLSERSASATQHRASEQKIRSHVSFSYPASDINSSI